MTQSHSMTRKRRYGEELSKSGAGSHVGCGVSVFCYDGGKEFDSRLELRFSRNSCVSTFSMAHYGADGCLIYPVPPCCPVGGLCFLLMVVSSTGDWRLRELSLLLFFLCRLQKTIEEDQRIQRLKWCDGVVNLMFDSKKKWNNFFWLRFTQYKA